MTAPAILICGGLLLAAIGLAILSPLALLLYGIGLIASGILLLWVAR